MTTPTSPPPGYTPPGSTIELLDRYAAGERYFAGAQLRKVNLSGARLWRVNLSRADLTGANLSGSMIEDADFSWADLTGADLSGARCHGARFVGAIISQARLPKNTFWTDSKISAEASDIYRGRNECVFVSYAHVDKSLVSSIVALVRSLGSRVFMDVSSIAPGEEWRPALTEALDEARIVIVFWCEHSALSQEVEKEYRTAHSQQKAVIPVLLDATPARPPLSDYQWLDFTGTFASHDASRTRERFAEDQRRHAEDQRRRAEVMRDLRPEPDVMYHLGVPPSLSGYSYEDIRHANEALLRTIVAEIESGTKVLRTDGS